MHREMREQGVPLARHQREKPLFHIVKHIDKNTEVKIRGAERQIPENRKSSYEKSGKQRGANNN
jgi:hypothetical protein